MTRYIFKQGVHIVADQPSKKHQLIHATIDTHDGDYTCIAYIDTVPSNVSASLHISSMYVMKSFGDYFVQISLNSVNSFDDVLILPQLKHTHYNNTG